MAKRKYSDGPGVSTSRGDVESSLGPEYEVFLSFRGPDTRRNFADCLYHAMDGAGIRVFRDDEEIRKGEEIGAELKRAIESSSICIPIFSRNYAVSAWCLRELAYMVHRKAMILPIFFDVEPKDVKLKTNLYQDALQEHKEKYGCEDVQRWEEALVKVAHLKGWDVRDTGHGELIKLIVTEVLIKLNKRDKKLPDHLVGIEDPVKDVMRLIDEGSPDVRYLVIHGMGGIGKTTIAKVVFNQISSRFHGCSFLLNVREASKGGHVVQLQKQLLSDILNIKQVEISDYDVGINQIERRFRNKKVLIVLDDLDKRDHLMKLAEKRDWFGLGSRIIITTWDTNFLPIEEENRENNVRTDFKEFKIYEMRELCHQHALQLFSKHAFRMDSPPHDYYHISDDIIRKTGGLPLALEVIGSSLCGKSQQLWKATLKKLELVPNQDVRHKLMISFDMLEDAQKEIFLDIACYFIGEEKIHPHYMWKALDFSPKIEIPVLSRMSLIKVDGDVILSMHDLLRDLGRDIVRQEDKFLEKRSRLWSPKDALNVVQHRKGTDKITALKLTGLPKEHNFTSEEFSQLPNLRLLELEGGNLTGDFKNLLSSLKWLSWHRCPADLQAVNLCLGNLVVLKLSDCEIPENWNGWGPCLANHDLKVLHLMRCRLSATPDFSTCLNLRTLAFVEHCPESIQIGSSIGKLERLKRLEIIAARVQPSTLYGSPHFDLCAIPSTICRLKNLSSLKLERQCMRELHPSIGEMAGLTCLSLMDCYRLRKLPYSIGKLRSLLELNLFNTRIRRLPNSIGDLKRLETMNLGCTRIRELPNSIGGLESLLGLYLQCTDIIELPASIGYLKRLQCLIAIESKIRGLPDSIGDLKRLEIMELRDTRIRELPNSIGGLESLVELDLGCTDIIALPASIGYLKRLQHLFAFESKIRGLPDSIGDLKRLEIITLRDTRIRELPNSIGGLESLVELDLGCTDIIALPASIGYLKRLQRLSASESNIRELPDSIGDLKRLEGMDLDCTQIRELPNSIGGLESLLDLSLSKSNITELPASIGYLTRLETLWICESMIRELPKDMGMFKNLTRLTRCGSRNIDITWPPRLTSLHIFCDDPQSFPRLPLVLRYLGLYGVKSPLEQPLLSEFGYLYELTLCGWGLRDIEFKHVENLNRLKVTRCELLARLSGLSSLRKLTSLDIFWCSQLIEIRDLGEMDSLQDLAIGGCRSIERITDLSKIHQLRSLHIYECESLQGLPDLSKLHKLQELRLSHCKALQGLPAVPNTCRRDVHACPPLGEYGGQCPRWSPIYKARGTRSRR